MAFQKLAMSVSVVGACIGLVSASEAVVVAVVVQACEAAGLVGQLWLVQLRLSCRKVLVMMSRVVVVDLGKWRERVSLVGTIQKLFFVFVAKQFQIIDGCVFEKVLFAMVAASAFRTSMPPASHHTSHHLVAMALVVLQSLLPRSILVSSFFLVN